MRDENSWITDGKARGMIDSEFDGIDNGFTGAITSDDWSSV